MWHLETDENQSKKQRRENEYAPYCARHPSLPPLLCSLKENPNTVLQGIAKASILSVFPSQVTRVSTLRESHKEGATTA
jgi:hypothetical protein